MLTTFFLAKLFLVFLESSETQFDLVAPKIGLINLVIYSNNLVNFLRILRTKSTTISQKLKIAEIEK